MTALPPSTSRDSIDRFLKRPRAHILLNSSFRTDSSYGSPSLTVMRWTTASSEMRLFPSMTIRTIRGEPSPAADQTVAGDTNPAIRNVEETMRHTHLRREQVERNATSVAASVG